MKLNILLIILKIDWPIQYIVIQLFFPQTVRKNQTGFILFTAEIYVSEIGGDRVSAGG